MEATWLLVLAAVLAGCRPVRIPRLRIDLVPIHPFLLLALAMEGGFAAALVGLAGVLGAAALRHAHAIGGVAREDQSAR